MVEVLAAEEHVERPPLTEALRVELIERSLRKESATLDSPPLTDAVRPLAVLDSPPLADDRRPLATLSTPPLTWVCGPPVAPIVGASRPRLLHGGTVRCA